MLNNIFDSHAHYDDEAFEADRLSLLEKIDSKGVCGIVNCGTNLQTSLKALDLSRKFDFVFSAVGIHPEEVENASDDNLAAIKQLSSNEKVVAIGEIGLDYHWDMPRDLQRYYFEQQLILANELSLPVIVHDREAHEDTFNLLKKHKPKGVMHCFSGSIEMMNEILKLGLYVGLGGAVTFKNAKRPVQVARNVPAERLLLETDCPYMAPTPHRGKRCDSSMIADTARFIAAVRNENAQQLIDRCTENTKELFNISR